MKTSPFFRFLMVNTRAGGAPADAEGITRAEDEEEGLNDADRSTLYNLFKEDLQFIKSFSMTHKENQQFIDSIALTVRTSPPACSRSSAS